MDKTSAGYTTPGFPSQANVEIFISHSPSQMPTGSVTLLNGVRISVEQLLGPLGNGTPPQNEVLKTLERDGG